MTEQKFINICKELVASYSNSKNETQITADDVYVVWNAKVLQNNKALLSSPVPDTRYYELTYNGDKHELYFDAYTKEKNDCFKVASREDISNEN